MKKFSVLQVREIDQEVSLNSEPDQPKDVKQTAAVDLISRLNNFRSYSDAGNLKGDFSSSLKFSC